MTSHKESASCRAYRFAFRSSSLTFLRALRDNRLHIINTVLLTAATRHTHQQSHARSDLLILLFGSRAVLAEVLRRFIPSMRAQNDFLRAADFGDRFASAFFTGGFKLPPVALLYEARPLAFKPPLGFFPAFRCHAGVAIYFFLRRLIVRFGSLRSACFLATRGFGAAARWAAILRPLTAPGSPLYQASYVLI